MEDIESYFLKAIGSVQRDLGKIPDFMIRTEKTDKVRLVFRNRIEKPINFGDFTVITLSPKEFVNITTVCSGFIKKKSEQVKKKDKLP